MKLHELLAKVSWENVWSKIQKFFPDQEEQKDAYFQVFQQLPSLKPEKSNLKIVIGYPDYPPDWKEEDEADFPEVWGTKRGVKEPYALEFSPWTEWMGMELAKETLRDYSDSEIMAYCLWEMTYFGFDEQTIQSEFTSLKKTADEWKQKSDEEKKRDSISLDELKKRLDLD